MQTNKLYNFIERCFLRDIRHVQTNGVTAEYLDSIIESATALREVMATKENFKAHPVECSTSTKPRVRGPKAFVAKLIQQMLDDGKKCVEVPLSTVRLESLRSGIKELNRKEKGHDYFPGMKAVILNNRTAAVEGKAVVCLEQQGA